MLNDISTLVSLCKRRGFVFQGSELYGGIGACYDYGPLGVLLKNNIKSLWWHSMIQRPDIEGLDSAILMSSKVWEASGHVENFTDPLVDCRQCKTRFREDECKEPGKCPSCKSPDITDPRDFNLMFETHMGSSTDSSSQIFLRPETAQGIYINFLNVMQSTRQKLPFGIAQIGKAFRNEITARNFIFRMREFEQMEMQFFVTSDSSMEWFTYWLSERHKWYRDVFHLPVKPIDTPDDALAHYAKRATDIHFEFPFGLEEIEGVHHRGDFDLTRHGQHANKDVSVFVEELKQRVVPNVIETSCGVDRLFLAALVGFYREDELTAGEKRTYFAFPFELAPYPVTVFPLMKKEPLMDLTHQVVSALRDQGLFAQLDVSGSIGKRYRRADEIGTPLGITVDFDSLDDQMVTVRDRDTAEQIRVPIADLGPQKLRSIHQSFRK